MAEAELRFDDYWWITPPRGASRLVPVLEVPEAAPELSSFKTEVDGMVLDWSLGHGWFGRAARDAPWERFVDADSGMAALGIANLIRPHAVVTPPEAFVTVTSEQDEEVTPGNDEFLDQMLFEEEEAAALDALEHGEEA